MSPHDVITTIQRALAPMKNRIMLMVGRAVIAAVKDAGKIQVVQVKGLAGESLDGVPRMAEFGFSSNPPKGSDAVVVAVGSSRESLVVIATEHKQTRIKNLVSGESVIYTDDGTKIHLKKNGQILVKTTTKVLIDTADVEITGNLKVLGTTHGVGAATFDDTVDAAKDITGAMNVKAGINVQATALVQAAGYSGPAGGGPSAPMVTSVPIQSTSTITTSSTITASDVTAGGTTMSTLKSAHNAHKHSNPEGGTTGPADTPA